MPRTPLIAGLELQPNPIRLTLCKVYFATVSQTVSQSQDLLDDFAATNRLVVQANSLSSNWAIIQARLSDAEISSTVRRTAKARTVLVVSQVESAEELTMRIANALAPRVKREVFYSDLGWLARPTKTNEQVSLRLAMPKPAKLWVGAVSSVAVILGIAGAATFMGQSASETHFAYASSHARIGSPTTEATGTTAATGTKTDDIAKPMSLGVARALLSRGLAALESRQFDSDVALDFFTRNGFEPEVISIIELGGDVQIEFTASGESQLFIAKCSFVSDSWALTELQTGEASELR